jgi:hypothetical protein
MKASWRMRMKFKDVRDGLSGPGSGPLAGKEILAPATAVAVAYFASHGHGNQAGFSAYSPPSDVEGTIC